jgi:protein TonB
MRFTLPESSAPRQRSTLGTLLSASIHAALIGGVLAATGMSAERRRSVPPQPEKLIFVKKLTDEDRHTPPTRSRDDRPIPRTNDRFVPPPLKVQDIIVDPTLVPSDLPDVGAGLAAVFDPTVGARLSDGGGTDAGAGGPGGDVASPLTALAVDREVVPRGDVSPRYPGQLVSAGVEGTVLAQFVVDTLGRVERESIVMLRSDHRQFELSVREALARMRFVPAEARGRKVRQLVQQPFSFALTRP